MTDNGNPEVMVVLCTAPHDSAETIAKEIIKKHLGACVNILPVKSVYRWEGEICNESEDLLIIKTTSEVTRELTDTLVSIHPYDIPEVICLPVTSGHTDYLSWVTGEINVKN